MGIEDEHHRKAHQRYDEKQKARDAETSIHHHDKIKTSPATTANLQDSAL